MYNAPAHCWVNITFNIMPKINSTQVCKTEVSTVLLGKY